MTGRDAADAAAGASDDALRARLQRADPAASLPPADPDRVARLLEATMDTRDTHPGTPLTESREDGTRGRSPLTWLVAAAAVLLIAGVAVFGLLGDDDEGQVPPVAQEPTADAEPTVTVLAAPAGTGERCMVPTAEVLAGQTLAFAGTVTEIEGEVVTLEPERFYAGEVTDLVEVQAPTADELRSLIGLVGFEVGGDYLVSATEGRVTACGFSGRDSERLRGLYEEAFPG